MKITFVLHDIGLGGGNKVVFEYANRLQNKGHDVAIVYPSIPLNNGKKWHNIINLSNKVLGTIFNLKHGNKVDWFNLKTKLIMTPILSEHYIVDADIIVATAWETSYPVSKLSKKKGAKFYLVQHYEIWDLWDDNQCWKEVEKIESDPNKLCLAMADVVPQNPSRLEFKKLVDNTYRLPLKKITISSWLKELIENKFGEKVEGMIINGVNYDIFYCQNKKLNKKKRILMPFRKTIWKGVDDGFKALKIVRERFHDKIDFVMYGTRKDACIPEWVEFHERVSDDLLTALYCSSDIFVLPSWVEGCQLPPMEAMACKCAVVATNVGGVPDYTIPGKTALVSPPKDPEALAQNIIRLIENEDELKRITDEGYDNIKQFTWDRATDELEKIFKKYV